MKVTVHLDMILSNARAKHVVASPPAQPTIQELRKQHGTDDDDELLLRALVPAADLDRMRAAGPLRRDYPMLSSPELEFAANLIKTIKLPYAQVRVGDVELELFGRADK